jgi:hypothetical protein
LFIKGVLTMMSKKLAFRTAACAFVLACAPSAYATDFSIGPPGSNFFITRETNHLITAIFYNSFSSTTPWFDDRFLFTIPWPGLGSGSISTSFSDPNNSLVIDDLILNGVHYFVPAASNGQSTSVGLVPIFPNVENVIEVAGHTTGANGYTGTATLSFAWFAEPFPEAPSWMVMLGGFGMIGALMRHRRVGLTFTL